MRRMAVAPREGADELARRSGVFRVERKLASGEVHRAWDETLAYVLDRDEVNQLLALMEPIISMSREAIDFLLDGEWGTIGIPRNIFELTRDSFDNEELEMFTRYDFAYIGPGELKLVGIEADSPRGILETAQAQRTWLWDKFTSRVKNGEMTQLNSIPETSVQALKLLRSTSNFDTLTIIKNSDEKSEDTLTSAYIEGLAKTAGWNVNQTRIRDLEWDVKTRYWMDKQRNKATNIYKHFPWDMLLRQSIGKELINNNGRVERLFEPAWKIVANNRAMLPALWHLFPDSNTLSPSSIYSAKGLGARTVSSTLMQTSSRNEMAMLDGKQFTSWGEPLKDFSNQKTLVHRKLEIPKRYQDKAGKQRFTYVSLYTVAGNMAALGFRETRMPLLGTHSTFRPHLVRL